MVAKTQKDSEGSIMHSTCVFLKDKAGWHLYLQRVILREIPHELPLDDNVHSLVEALNNLPFLYTMGSCGGHVKTRENMLTNPYWIGKEDLIFSGYAVYMSGWFTFTIDGSQRSKRFVEELMKLLQKYRHTDLKNMPQTSPFAYAVILARQEKNQASITKEEAEEFAGQTQDLIQQITELAKRFKEGPYEYWCLDFAPVYFTL